MKGTKNADGIPKFALFSALKILALTPKFVHQSKLLPISQMWLLNQILKASKVKKVFSFLSYMNRKVNLNCS